MKLLTETINALAAFGTKKVSLQEDNEIALLGLLAALHYCYYTQEYKQDDMQYSDPPVFDYTAVSKYAAKNFPDLGDYNTVAEVSIKIGKAQKVVGHALHNLTIIIQDALHLQWCLLKTSKKNALWQFKTLYESHFCLHLVELIKYLEYKKIEH